MHLPTHPLFKPALRRLWRDLTRATPALQLGIEAPHAVVVSGLDAGEARVLDLLDGTRDVDGVRADAAAFGVDADRVDHLLDVLAATGALDEGGPDAVSARRADRLAPDLLSVSLVDRAPGAAPLARRRRRDAVVAVYGTGRVGAAVASLLAAAGVGALHCVDREPVRPVDLTPVGLPATSAESRGATAAAVITRTTSARASDASPRGRPTVAVVAPTTPLPTPEVLTAVRSTPHLLVGVRETRASIGPFVDPGRTACIRCVELDRADRDPAWPALAAALLGATRRVDACDVTLATLAGALAAMQVLTWVDAAGATQPASVGGVLAFDLTDGRLRRRSIDAHPACGCMAAPSAGTMAG